MSTVAQHRPYLSMQGAADRMGVSLSSVRRRVADGQLPAGRLGRRVLIAEDDIDASIRMSRGLTSALDAFGRAAVLDGPDARARARAALDGLDRLDAAPPDDPGGLDDLLASLAEGRREGVAVAP